MVTDASSELTDAFVRARHDQQKRTFFRHPSDLLVVNAYHLEWLAALQNRLDDGTYTPRPAPLLGIPKPEWHIRPGAILTLEDQVVYHYLALLARSVIASQLQWSEGKIRYSNYLAKGGASWFRLAFVGWKNFSRASIEKLKEPSKHVLIADIAGYYENIDIGRLMQDLRASGVDSSVTDFLSSCLNKWAGPRGRGIPQGYSPSDLFGEFYLNNVDQALATEGFEHVRYLDDYRVFADSKVIAIQALHRLSELLRERGLNLQTAKSYIQDANQAREQFSVVARVLADVSQRIGNQLKGSVALDPYITPGALREYIRSDPDDPAPAVVEAAWNEFEAGDFGDFNKSVFHFLIARLSELRSDVAVPFVITQLSDRPEETQYCLDYLEALLDDIDGGALDDVAALLADRNNVFEYQKHQILRWFWEKRISNDTVRTFCRRQLTAQTDSSVLLPHAAVYIGHFADGLHDYEKLESAFFNDTDQLTRAAYLYALRLAPRDLKGRVYGRARGESTYLDKAVEVARRDAQ